MKVNKPKIVVVEPVLALRQVNLKLDHMDVEWVNETCGSMVYPLRLGWHGWEKTIPIGISSRRKRGATDAVVGGVGLEARIVNSIDIEVIANKLSTVSHEVKQLKTPITSLLSNIE